MIARFLCIALCGSLVLLSACFPSSDDALSLEDVPEEATPTENTLTWQSLQGRSLALLLPSDSISESIALFKLPDDGQPYTLRFVSPLLPEGEFVEVLEGPAMVQIPALPTSMAGRETLLHVDLESSVDVEQLDIIVRELQPDLWAYSETLVPEAVLSSSKHAILVDQNVALSEASDLGVSLIVEDGRVAIESNRGLCFRAVLPSNGVAKWQSSNPGYGGQRFSYAPESNPALQWASAPDDAVDAIYRTSWGCYQALKVQNGCTATVSTSGSISSCCNLTWIALGSSVYWFNPSSTTTQEGQYFVDCPL